MRRLFIVSLSLLLTSCGTTLIDVRSDISDEVTAEVYAAHRATMGTVLLDAKWARQWKCGAYENAQLVSFGFDRMPPSAAAIAGKPDIVIGTRNQLIVQPHFVNIAVLVPPGEYALSSFKIKVAESVSKVGYLTVDRQDLLRDGKLYAGSFRVAAGETVYIGNFALDCVQQPVLWRYYTQGKQGFQQHLTQYKNTYPFLDVSSVQYRLFETSILGRPYELK